MFRLTLRTLSPIPLDVTGITPDRVTNLSATNVARLPVHHGNRREPLGEHFDVIPQSSPDLQFVGDTGNVHGVGAGMTGGRITVENDAGRHAGAGMAGGELLIRGGAGDWLGAEMRGGGIEVRGACGNCVGSAYRGSRRGMTGGTILLRGAVGDELGLLMRRGLIAVEGPVGEFAGASMIAGTILLFGGAGERLGAGMKRGTIAVFGDAPCLPPGFRYSCEYDPSFLRITLRGLARRRVIPDGATEPRVVACYRGDLINGGRGEVLHVRL